MLSVELRPSRPVAHGLGGRLSLALANSVLWRRSEEPIDRITGYGELAGYVHTAGGIDDATLAELESAADADPAGARSALGRALALREAIFRLFSSVAASDEPDAADLAALDRVFRAGMRQLRLDGGSPRWSGLDVPAWEAAVDAVALLGNVSASQDGRAGTAGHGPDARDPRVLKQCPGETCGWLFVDESRNHSRQWCDSRMCGNRARARRHYQRHRDQRRAATGGRP